MFLRESSTFAEKVDEILHAKVTEVYNCFTVRRKITKLRQISWTFDLCLKQTNDSSEGSQYFCLHLDLKSTIIAFFNIINCQNASYKQQNNIKFHIFSSKEERRTNITITQPGGQDLTDDKICRCFQVFEFILNIKSDI